MRIPKVLLFSFALIMFTNAFAQIEKLPVRKKNKGTFDVFAKSFDITNVKFPVAKEEMALYTINRLACDTLGNNIYGYDKTRNASYIHFEDKVDNNSQRISLLSCLCEANSDDLLSCISFNVDDVYSLAKMKFLYNHENLLEEIQVQMRIDQDKSFMDTICSMKFYYNQTSLIAVEYIAEGEQDVRYGVGTTLSESPAKKTSSSFSALFEHLLISNVQIYPNPFQNQLFIKSSDKIIYYELIDIKGIRVDAKKTNNTLVELNTSTLINGIYFLRWKTEQEEGVKKIIKE